MTSTTCSHCHWSKPFAKTAGQIAIGETSRVKTAGQIAIGEDILEATLVLVGAVETPIQGDERLQVCWMRQLVK